jgi:hypothetical protein
MLCLRAHTRLLDLGEGRPSFFVLSGTCAGQGHSYRTDQTDASSWIFDNAGAKADELHIV